MVKVSFVCPIYNKSSYIKKVLTSIRQQNGSYEKEYIFINDGSEDSSLSKLKRFTNKWSNVQILTQSNLGPANATQRGIDLSTGDYIKLVGGDDIMSNDCTSILLTAIKKKRSVAVYSNYSLLKNYNKIKFPENKKIINYRIIVNPIIDTIQSSFSGTTPTLYDHKAIKRSNGCNKKLFVEDFSLALELSKLGNFCFIDNLTSFGPKDDTNRIMNNKKTQLIHDYNAALYYFIKNNYQLESKAKIIACKKAIGRTNKWAIRNSKANFLNKMLFLRIILSSGITDYVSLLKQSCLYFYDKVKKNEIRYQIK